MRMNRQSAEQTGHNHPQIRPIGHAHVRSGFECVPRHTRVIRQTRGDAGPPPSRTCVVRAGVRQCTRWLSVWLHARTCVCVCVQLREFVFV